MNKFIPRNYKREKFHQHLKFKVQQEYKHLTLKIGSLGLKLLESGQLSSTVLEAVRKTVSRRIKKIGKLLIFVHANVALTKKSLGVRMGKGSGSLHSWVAPVKSGKIIMELQNVPYKLGLVTLNAASSKIPLRTRVITK